MALLDIRALVSTGRLLGSDVGLQHYMDWRSGVLDELTAEKSIQQRSSRYSLSAILSRYLYEPHSEYPVRINPAELHTLKAYGYAPRDVALWAWVLDGPDADSIVERFVQLPAAPTFLLQEVLRQSFSQRRTSIISSQTFASLLAYLSAHSRLIDLRSTRRADELLELPPSPAVHDDIPVSIRPLLQQRRPLPYHHQISDIFLGWPSAFRAVFSGLLDHARQLSPPTMVQISKLAATYLQRMHGKLLRRNTRAAFLGRPIPHSGAALLNNFLITSLQRASNTNPYKNSIYNWEGQKALLANCANFNPPLPVSKSSYQALSIVLLAQKKSSKEAMVASRMSRSWPPWRVDRDGMDARRPLTDDISRPVRVLIQMAADGHPASTEEYLKILGGRESDGTPTIHTRSFPRSPDRSRESASSLEWAARIKSTRDVQEAWNAFLGAEKANVAPTVGMFYEMLDKLTMERVQQARALPEQIHSGDGKELMPIDHQNLSAFERARIQPPTVEELYERMKHRGVEPDTRCLGILIARARTLEGGMKFIMDSTLSREGVNALLRGKSPERARQLPLTIFNAYIDLLCRFARLHGNGIPPTGVTVDENQSSSFSGMAMRQLYSPQLSSKLVPLQLAVGLVQACTPSSPQPWHALLRALSRDIQTDVDYSALLHDTRCLELMSTLVKQATAAHVPPTGLTLHHLSQAVTRAILTVQRHGSEEDVVRVQDHGRALITDYFHILASPLSDDPDLPKLFHQLDGAHLHAYIRALGFLYDFDGIVDVVRFIIRHRGELHLIVQQSSNGVSMFHRVFTAVRVFLGDTPQSARAASLVRSIADSPWIRWPSDDDATMYISYWESRFDAADAGPDDLIDAPLDAQLPSSVPIP